MNKVIDETEMEDGGWRWRDEWRDGVDGVGSERTGGKEGGRGERREEGKWRN